MILSFPVTFHGKDIVAYVQSTAHKRKLFCSGKLFYRCNVFIWQICQFYSIVIKDIFPKKNTHRYFRFKHIISPESNNLTNYDNKLLNIKNRLTRTVMYFKYEYITNKRIYAFCWHFVLLWILHFFHGKFHPEILSPQRFHI